MKPFCCALLLLVCGLASAADPAASPVTTLDAKLNKNDLSIDTLIYTAKVELTADDWRAIGKAKIKHLKGFPLTDESAEAIGHLDQLVTLNTNGGNVSDEGLARLAGLKNVKAISLGHVNFTETQKKKGPLGGGLAALAKLNNLERIGLNGLIGDAAVQGLSNVKSLQSVGLFHSWATDKGMPALKSLPKLREVSFVTQFNPAGITEASFAVFGEIPTLEQITAGETLITYEHGFVHLKKLPKLKKLVLRDVIASDADIEKLKADLPQLQVTWTKPKDAVAETAKAKFESFRARKSKKK